MSTPLQERLGSRTIRTSDGCLLWQGAISDDGYGRIGVDGKVLYTHRVSWELANGRAIPPGYEVDHLCRRPSCLEPSHLEVVTKSTNSARSSNGFALTGYCRSGEHKITSEEDWFVKTGGGRLCKECRREYMRQYKASRRNVPVNG